ncbi:hydrolase [Mycolicibacterium chitae]|uniref:Alpha/beta hydrolase fold protein n=1 Tax=Mycolicibacterium chitae TaxID=1792 RepID=A0A3S5EIT8_MYCCI|nr:alpha/beta hydrolase [Mycolicibacterium chitae]MCV7107874.1 alpha/beta hydrolase [Mycolicibacterium chitae]BBZ01985.1 hydrolase [Mycolicibacterium chitae]VEG50809.1 alpha/beta hydrolase fold protein [Mycolicibacterium chitae]
MSVVHHRAVTVDGYEIFYREAGPADAPAVVLLHGYPTSSFMFRELIPLLAGDYHVIAPDHLGFGRSDAPGVGEFDYTFEALARLTSGLLDHLGLERYALYVHDYGAPIGWRLALEHPERITAVVTQNGNGYEDGFVESFWEGIWAYGANPGPDTEPAVRVALSLDAIRWQYVHGVSDPSTVSPDTWEHDFALVSREGNDEVQLALFRDYRNNRPLYPLLHEFLRTNEVPVLAVWGRNDEIFAPAGAQAFARDAKDAEVHLIDGGHFLLESHLDVVAGHVRGFLGRVLG